MFKKKKIKDILLGKALTGDQLKHEKLSTFWGLPIMASDAVSSVAYAVEEILMALILPIGLLSVYFVGLVSLPIIVLLIILVFSYSQIINHYPGGGGSYTVSKENFGRRPALLAASCLIIDYIMTVAVSISSSTAAIVATFPELESYKIFISLICVALITLLNLRGISESSKIFGVPTYMFIVSMLVMVGFGLFRFFTGSLNPIEYSPDILARLEQTRMANVSQMMSGITMLLFLRAFSAGCSALTGVEAVSNAIPSFKEPSQKTAKHVLFLLGGIIVLIFGGTSFLATVLKVIPLNTDIMASLPANTATTVMSQMANSVFGNGIMFYVIQFTTSLILLLAANTAYNGLPILLSILSKDRYMPRQFAQRGTKLSFSNGIMFIAVFAGVLLIAFDADTHRLIPFYSVGVFVSFTISQAGMFVKWTKLKEKGWKYKSLINGFGALITLVGTAVVFFTKFTQGAWMLVVAIPLIMLFMGITHKHYTLFERQISINGYQYKYKPSKSGDKIPCVVLVHNMNKATLKAFDYAKDISSDVTALHISTTPAHSERLQKQWEELQIGIPLTVILAPHRDILAPLEEYISEREKKLEKGENLTVVLTKFVGNGWRDSIFHNQTTFFIESKLGRHRNIATVLVPYIYSKSNL